MVGPSQRCYGLAFVMKGFWGCYLSQAEDRASHGSAGPKSQLLGMIRQEDHKFMASLCDLDVSQIFKSFLLVSV